jgi:alkylated DNA repair dioxygenase AlkB
VGTINTALERRLLPSLLSPNDAVALFSELVDNVSWDNSMKVRKTACYGEAYDESGVDLDVEFMHPLLVPVCVPLCKEVGFLPANSLLKYYEDGRSTMSFHSDATSSLEGDIVIVSLGAKQRMTCSCK